MSTFRILSIDGGGVRGVYTAVLLNRIAQEIPELFDETHFFAGTSTGSILALGLAFQKLVLVSSPGAYSLRTDKDPGPGI